MSPSKHKQCFHFYADPSDIEKCVREGHFVFILMRGAPGSGKTTLAKQFISSLSSSDYSHHGSDNCQSPQKRTKAIRSSLLGSRLVIVDADHEERSEIRKLAEMAINEEYEVFVVEPRTTWIYSAEECAKKTSRSEDLESIQRKIDIIKESPLTWDHLINGGEKNVRISNFHTDDIPLQHPECSPTSSTISSPIFSMVPHKNEKSMRSVGVQVTSENIARSLADLPDDSECGCDPETEKIVPEVWKEGLRTSERSVQSKDEQLLVGTREEIEFGMLRAVFQETDLSSLRHYQQQMGFIEAFQLFVSLNEPISSGIIPTDDRLLLDELGMEESLSVSLLSVDEEMKQRELERRTLKFIEDRSHINQETVNDEQIALLLQSEFDDEHVYEAERKSDMNNVELLCRMFPEARRNKVEMAFEASDRNLAMAKSMLIDEGEVEDVTVHGEQPKANSYSRKVVANMPVYKAANKTPSENKNHFLKNSGKNTTDDLSTVQRIVIEQRHSMLLERQQLRTCSVPGLYRQQTICERVISQKASIEAGVARINEQIRRAHASPWNLDLHYMTVDGAKKLVMEAIEAVRYHMRGGRNVVNRITIITGSGNNSRGGAKIKPEVAAMLKREGIPVEQINEGCIRIKV